MLSGLRGGFDSAFGPLLRQTSATSIRDRLTGEAGWCHCMLHSDSTSGCGVAPLWLQDHTGREGELYFKVQDSAWGNAMMQLKDSVSHSHPASPRARTGPR